jgi:hypothetical protein
MARSMRLFYLILNGLKHYGNSLFISQAFVHESGLRCVEP